MGKTIQDIADEVCSLYSYMSINASVSSDGKAIWSCGIMVNVHDQRVDEVALAEEMPSAEEAANEAYRKFCEWRDETGW